jgi:hypothetical protein
MGLAKEGTWGTWLTPTRWVEMESETLEWKPKRIVGVGLANGLAVQRNATRQQTTSTVQGDIKCPMYYKSMGLFLGGIMGTLTTTPVQQGATIAYLQTHALAVNTIGQSLSFQKGVPEVTTGTIRQYDYFGAKISKAVFECAIDQFLQATYTIDAKGYDTTNTYATPVYQTPNPIFAFNQGNFKFGPLGSEVVVEGIRKWTMTIERPLRVDNFYLDGTGLKQEQVGNNFVKITVDLESDYVTDAAFIAQFAGDTAQSMIMDFVGPVIASTFKNEIQFQVPNLRWEAGQPLIAGPDLVMPKLQLVGLYNDVNTAATITYMSTDVAL